MDLFETLGNALRPEKIQPMYAIALHDTETEGIVGYVHPVEPMNMPDFDDKLRESWTNYQSWLKDDFGLNYDIEDFVEWHNCNYEMKIDTVIIDFIQLL